MQLHITVTKLYNEFWNLKWKLCIAYIYLGSSMFLMFLIELEKNWCLMKWRNSTNTTFCSVHKMTTGSHNSLRGPEGVMLADSGLLTWSYAFPSVRLEIKGTHFPHGLEYHPMSWFLKEAKFTSSNFDFIVSVPLCALGMLFFGATSPIEVWVSDCPFCGSAVIVKAKED